MGTRTTITTRLLALTALLLVPVLALGAGLGKLALHSALGEDLRADIDVVSLQRGETTSLSAKIASPEAFHEAGVDYVPAISSLRASIQRREGKYYVVLTSTQPINDPFLDVLVELNWATGLGASWGRLWRPVPSLWAPGAFTLSQSPGSSSRSVSGAGSRSQVTMDCDQAGTMIEGEISFCQGVGLFFFQLYCSKFRSYFSLLVQYG